MKKILIFGSSGSIGNYLYNKFSEDNQNFVYGTTSKPKQNENEKNIYVSTENIDELKNIENVDIVIWSQGYNFNDNINIFDEDEYMKIMNVNVLFILKTLSFLLKHKKINEYAKLVIISSIWEQLTRENKLSYTISKSALSGLVKNVAFDLSSKNILINNILPGVIDNQMSRNTLTSEQMLYIQTYTGFNRLIQLDDLYNTVKFLTFENTGITGESIKVDLGFTNIKKYS
jgi:NAD(P)-dependent dehydrogenase (short-subunit alcohol dehydrogenase family)